MENKKPLTKLQREYLISRIIKNPEKNPEYKKHVENRIEEITNKKIKPNRQQRFSNSAKF